MKLRKQMGYHKDGQVRFSTASGNYPSVWENEEKEVAKLIKQKSGAIRFGLDTGQDIYLNYDGRYLVFKKDTRIPTTCNSDFLDGIKALYKHVKNFLEEQAKPKWQGRSADAIAMYLYAQEAGYGDVDIPTDSMIDFGDGAGPRMVMTSHK